MSAIFEYTYCGVTYRYELTLKAKAELEKVQKRRMNALLGGDSENTKVLTEYMQASQALETAKAAKDEARIAAAENRINELQGSLVQVAGTMDLGESDDELYEVMYILLHCHRDYRTVTRELSDEIIEDMEYKLGVEDCWQKLTMVYDKVFTEIEAMNAARQSRLGQNRR